MALEGTFTPDDLIAGDVDIVTETATLLSGQNTVRGSVLGKVTASGKLKLYAAADSATVTPHAIQAADVNASSADKPVPVYLAGQFNNNKLTYGASTTIADVGATLRDAGIFIITNAQKVPSVG